MIETYQAPSTQDGGRSGRRLALIVGVNGSQGIAHHKPFLKFAEDNAHDIARILQMGDMPFELIQPPLLAREASTEQVRKAILNVRRQVANDDIVLFYFSGHGLMMESQPHDVYLVTSTFDMADVEIFQASHISFSELRTHLYLETKARQVCLILDCCYAGEMGRTAPDPYLVDLQRRIHEYFNPPGQESGTPSNGLRIALTATGHRKEAFEEPEKNLTQLLLPVLRGDIEAVYDDHGRITVHRAYLYLRDKMSQYPPNLPGDPAAQDYVLAQNKQMAASVRMQRKQEEQSHQLDKQTRVIVHETVKQLMTDQHVQIHAPTVSFDCTPCMTATIEDLDLGRFEQYLSKDKVKTSSQFQVGRLTITQLQDFNFIANNTPLYGTLLCFGKKPEIFVMGASSRCFIWPTKDTNAPYIHEQEYFGDLLRQYEETMDFLQRTLKIARHIDNTDRWEIPFTVLTEAIANALIHRDYYQRNESIKISIFPDRIEISNPGILMFDMTVEDLASEHESVLRNPLIARIFSLYGLVEKVGSGITRMITELSKAGLQEPKFEINHQSKFFKVTLYRPAIEQHNLLLDTHRHSLALYLKQQTILGRNSETANITKSIESTRNEIRRIKAQLRGWGQTVEDHPDDEVLLNFETDRSEEDNPEARHEQSQARVGLWQNYLPSPRQWPAILALIIALSGVTTAAGFAFADQITKNPWRAAAVAVVYLLGVFVVTSVAEIWQRLKVPWLDQAARWVDHAARRRLARYPRRYRRFMVEQHRFFDVKGLTTQGPYSLMLDQVFVELSLAPQPAHVVGSNPIAVIPASLREGRHSIWAYLQAKQMRSQPLAILGPPGSGKTTLLRHIALVLASGKRPTGVAVLRRVPILLYLRDHAAAIAADPHLTLADAIREHLTRAEGPAPPPDWFERQLAAGRCVIMLDGLDEVAALEQRTLVVQWVDRQTVIHGANRFVVTSRPFGFRSNPLERVTVLEVRAFTRTQVERFVANWYLANEIMSAERDDAGVHRDAQRGAEDLLRRLRDAQNLAELAVNPLLLTMIANVHRYSSSLPERRVELYREICVVFLGKRQQARGLTLNLTPVQKQRVLQELAHAMMTRQVREIALADALPLIRVPLERVSMGPGVEAFLKQIEESSGLLLEREHQHYSFAHLNFQEYLAATYILEQGLEHELINHVHETWWHETIRLYVAQTDATRIVDACIASATPSIAALTLAIDCSEEARELHPDARLRLETLLIQGMEDADPKRRRLIVEALRARQLRHTSHLDDQRPIDTGPVSHTE